MEHQIGILVEREKTPASIALAVMVSVMLHSALLALFWLKTPSDRAAADPSLVRFVELMRQPAFVEAPGEEVKSAPLTAPFSNANRRAAMPQPAGDRRTTSPGNEGPYIPGSRSSRSSRTAQREESAQGSQQQPSLQTSDSPLSDVPFSETASKPRKTAAASDIDWKSAIQEVGKIASLGGEGLGNSGGDEGFAESGPISFETQWYDWGEYADAMVRRIRRNWYENMPPLIRMGMKGVVTIQFTIQRSGQMTDIRIIRSSDAPPYDYAARKALELSSPLQPLPADFPNNSERVTAQFYYNMRPPSR